MFDVIESTCRRSPSIASAKHSRSGIQKSRLNRALRLGGFALEPIRERGSYQNSARAGRSASSRRTRSPGSRSRLSAAWRAPVRKMIEFQESFQDWLSSPVSSRRLYET